MPIRIRKFYSITAKASSVALCCCLFFALVGCQSYQPRPLSPSEHTASWLARTADSESVRRFSEKLAESSHPEVRFDPSDGLTVEEGELVALVFNSDLRLARLRSGVTEATAKHAGYWDEPELGIDILKVTESVPSPWIVGSALSFTIPISGRLQVERSRAEAEHQAELLKVAELEWEVGYELRQAWIAWSFLQLHLEQTEQLAEVFDETIASHSKLAETGEVLKTEAALFSIEQASRRAEIARLKGDVAESEMSIRALMGLSPDAPVEFVPSLVPVETQANEAVDDNLTLARLKAEYETAELALLREIREQYPDIVIGPQGESDMGQSRIGFIGGIRLPILHANKGGVAEAKAERAVARAAYETELEETIGQLGMLRLRLQTIRSQRQLIDQQLVPMVDRQVADANRLVELGEGGTIVLLESLMRAHDAKLRLIDLKRDEAEIHNQIRHTLGPAHRVNPFPKTK